MGKGSGNTRSGSASKPSGTRLSKGDMGALLSATTGSAVNKYWATALDKTFEQQLNAAAKPLGVQSFGAITTPNLQKQFQLTSLDSGKTVGLVRGTADSLVFRLNGKGEVSVKVTATSKLSKVKEELFKKIKSL